MASISNPFRSDEVVGVASPEDSNTLRAAAEKAGFEIDVMIGPTDADKIVVDSDDSDSVFDTVLRFFQQGEEQEALRRYRDRLEAGDHVVRLLHVGDREKEAGEIMAANGAELVWHYGNWTYKPLHNT